MDNNQIAVLAVALAIGGLFFQPVATLSSNVAQQSGGMTASVVGIIPLVLALLLLAVVAKGAERGLP